MTGSDCTTQTGQISGVQASPLQKILLWPEIGGCAACVRSLPEPALALLSDTSSEELALSLCPEAPPFMVRVLAVLLKPAVRLPFDADAEPTLAPEPAMLLEPSPDSNGPTTTTAPFPALFPFVLGLAAGAAPVLANAVLDDGTPLLPKPACSAGGLWAADIGAVVSAPVSFRAVAGCSLSGKGACMRMADHILFMDLLELAECRKIMWLSPYNKGIQMPGAL